MTERSIIFKAGRGLLRHRHRRSIVIMVTTRIAGGGILISIIVTTQVASITAVTQDGIITSNVPPMLLGLAAIEADDIMINMTTVIGIHTTAPVAADK